MPSRIQWSLLTVVFLASIYWISAGRSQSHISTPNTEKTPSKTHAFRQRLIAVGDLHGDIENAKKVLRMAKIIDNKAEWIGGADILVQTGDIVDRGTYARDIYLLMRDLRNQAHMAGGKVVSILGNHEVMNAIGDWSKKRMEELSINGWLGQEWLANYSATALVALSPYASAPLLSFTHGSLRPSFSKLLPYPDAINALSHSLLTKALTPPMALPYPPNPYSGLPKGSTHEEEELYAGGGPFWWRGLAEVEDEKIVCGWADELKNKLGVRRLIGGHTPDFEKIVDRCNASIIIIDTGMSSAYGGVLSALEIVYTLTPIHSGISDHKQDPLMMSMSSPGSKYLEREEVHAIYEKRKKLIIVEEREITI